MRIESGLYGTCARDADGFLTCTNIYEAGTDDSPPDAPVTDFDYDSWAGCAVLAADGTLSCWGGEIPTSSDRDYNWMKLAVPPEGEFVAVAVDIDYACAVGVDGSIQCFSGSYREDYGWLYPWMESGRPFSPEGNDWIDVDIENENACGLHADGRIECWGDNTYGQMDGPT